MRRDPPGRSGAENARAAGIPLVAEVLVHGRVSTTCAVLCAARRAECADGDLAGKPVHPEPSEQSMLRKRFVRHLLLSLGAIMVGAAAAGAV